MFRKKLTILKLMKKLFLIFPVLFSANTWADSNQTYVVLYNQHKVPANAAHIISQNGGTLIYSYDQIGVVIAKSNSDSFVGNLLGERKVSGVSATTGFGTQLSLNTDEIAVSDFNSEPLADLQWNMRQIKVPEAHAITKGEYVTIGVIDGGIDTSHPDLASQIDYEKSVSCLGGVPNQEPGAIDDVAGHGTFVAGLIAAASNGIGITGVAPSSKLAIIKAATDDKGEFLPEAVICSFMWAGDKQLDVTNNSYFVDPNLFNCHNDPEQHAVWTAIRRAIQYAQSKGVSIVAAAGNSNIDLAHPETFDDELSNACNMIPLEMPKVIAVSGNGNLWEKAYNSNYGVGVIDVIAPGGDKFQVTEEAVNGRVLSTFPAFIAEFFLENIPPLAARIVKDCSSGTCAYYFYASGTSFATAHVTGVAALATSQHGKMAPGALQAVISSSADSIACPENSSECEGGRGYNSFNGHGQVNALEAVK